MTGFEPAETHKHIERCKCDFQAQLAPPTDFRSGRLYTWPGRPDRRVFDLLFVFLLPSQRYPPPHVVMNRNTPQDDAVG